MLLFLPELMMMMEPEGFVGGWPCSNSTGRPRIRHFVRMSRARLSRPPKQTQHGGAVDNEAQRERDEHNTAGRYVKTHTNW